MNKIKFGRMDVGKAVQALAERVNEMIDKLNTLTGESEYVPEGECSYCYGVLGRGKCPECGRIFGE